MFSKFLFLFFLYKIEILLYPNLNVYVCEPPFQKLESHPLSPPSHPTSTYTCGVTIVEDKFFTPHGFISLETCVMSTLSYILGKSILNPKRVHIYTKRRQNLQFKLIAHHFIFWLMIQAHESHQENFGSRGLEGQKVCSVKIQCSKLIKESMLLDMSSPIS